MSNRRGAIVVMTGVFIVALMLIAAISVNASRIFAAKNELQTASDAAALAGALQLLEGTDDVRGHGPRLRGAQPVEQNNVDSVEVEWGVWLPERAAVRPRRRAQGRRPRHDEASATAVTGPCVRRLDRHGQRERRRVVRRACNGAQCIKPIAVPYSRLLQILGQSGLVLGSSHR